ncbi:hypothetical protein [Pontibacter chitinilyticus]|uniref:hypothetical protein n=1 Tax=Pontibacter chitinilyticus TaxID=2674989 RepID=UPI00321A337A
MHRFLPKDPHLKLQALQHWSKLRQDQLSEAVLVTKDAVTGFIKRQLERGNWQQVEQLLKGKPMTKAAGLLFQELRGLVVSNLIIRLGLRRIIAVGLAGILIPFILAKVAQEVITRIKQQPADKNKPAAAPDAVSGSSS